MRVVPSNRAENVPAIYLYRSELSLLELARAGHDCRTVTRENRSYNKTARERIRWGEVASN